VETLYTAMAAGFEGAALPPFVRRELEGYLDCGLVCRGFLRIKWESCSEQHLVAFACKGRGICPFCPPSCRGSASSSAARSFESSAPPGLFARNRDTMVFFSAPLSARLFMAGSG
jgi:hypothetical protein